MSAFEIIPAIDLRSGRCVRLVQGDFDRETRYSDDPASVARQWREQGAQRIHVVDLDGAREGHLVNVDAIAAICSAVDVPVEVSGGLRSAEAVAQAFALGAERIQLGTAAVKDPALVRASSEAYPGKVVVSIDARGDEVMTEGWREGSGVSALDLAKRMVELGATRIMVTDIGRDGMLDGPNVEKLRSFVDALTVPVIASGGVSAVWDLKALASVGCEGAVVGKALYEGVFTLRSAIAELANHTPAERPLGDDNC